MKFRSLLTLLIILLTLPAIQAQERYIDEVFDSVIVVRDNLYGANISVLSGVPALDSLYLDVYMPAGDTETRRPVALVMHTGTFLPPGLFAATGMRNDYANIQVCERLAKRGYVAVNMDYRLGWNPVGEDITRRATILQAAYRSVQDMYTCIRFLHMTVDQFANPWGLAMDSVAFFGIGTGGFVGFNMVVLDDWRTEIFIDKFRDPVYGQPFIDTTAMGDLLNTQPGFINVQGQMIPFNIPLWVEYPNDFHFAFGLDGAVGDSSWMDTGDSRIPMALGGTVTHPTTPFGINFETEEIDCDMPVFTGGAAPVFVVNIAGSACMANKANTLGYNNILDEITYDDDVTETIRGFKYAEEHLWPIHLEGPQAGPWEYWDSTFWKTVPSPDPLYDNIHEAGLATNPDMSIEKANRYIDTALWFFAPRSAQALGLITTSTDDLDEAEFDFNIAPNPTVGEVRISIEGNNNLTRIAVFDMLGKMVRVEDNLNSTTHVMDLSGLPTGIYGIRAEVGNLGYLSSKLILQNN